MDGPACPACKAPLPARAAECPNCGTPLATGTTGQRSKRGLRGEYGEENLREVERIPGLEKAVAEALCKAGYNHLWKIQRASEGEIAKVAGVGPKNSALIHKALQSLLVLAKRKNKDVALSEECECPLCGTVTSIFATRCYDCGAIFDEEELDEAFRQEVKSEGEKGLLAYYDARLTENPGDVALLHARAMLLLTMGRPADALTALDAILQVDPHHTKALQAKALAFERTDGLGAAAGVLAETVRSIALAPPPPMNGPRSSTTQSLRAGAADGDLRAHRAGSTNRAADRKGRGNRKAAEREKSEALASPNLLASIKCPNCAEILRSDAAVCTTCGHRLAPEGAPAPERPPTVEEEKLLYELERAVDGEEKLPPPPLQPVVPPDVIAGKKSMAGFLAKVPGVSKRAADAVSGFFQDIEQVGHADVVQIAAIPGVAPAEARLMKVAVVRTLGSKAKPWPPEESEPAKAPPTLQGTQDRPSRPGGRDRGVAARRASGLEGRRGLINGSGMVNGRGRVNGLVNGTGFVNGVSIAEIRLPRGSLMPRYVAIGAGLLMLFAIAVSLVEPEPASLITIDGNFEDWESRPVYTDGTVSANPNVQIAETSIHVEERAIFLRVRVAGTIFADTARWETMYAFLDVDGNNQSGYDLGDLGADYAVRVSGSNRSVASAALLRFDDAGRERDDWAGFAPAAGLDAMSGGPQVEVAVGRSALDSYSDTALRVRFAFDDNAGETSHTLVPVGKAGGALLVEQSPEATTLTPGVRPFLTLTFRSLGDVGFVVTDIDLRTTSTATFTNVPVFEVPRGTSAVRTINVDATGVTPGSLVTATVTSVSFNVIGADPPETRPLSIVGPEARAYVSQLPPGKVIDGLFEDWPDPIIDSDPIPIRRRSLDVLARDASTTGNELFLYAQLGSEALEGGLTPHKPVRPAPSSPGGPAPVPSGPAAPLIGQDYVRFYVDTDAGVSGGFDAGGVHADRLLEVRGRGGRVHDAGLYRFVGATWVREGDLDWGLARDEIELGATLAGVTFSGTQFVVASADWFGIADHSGATGTRGNASGGTRGPPEPPAVMDVSGNGPFWFRDTTHSTETACTHNKVAAPIKGPGPVKGISLTTGQSACWYVDATAGQTIPTGTWETLLDLSQSGSPEYDVRIEIWNLDTDSVQETIQSCLDQTTFADDVRCFLDSVAQKVLSGTQVVRLVLAHSSASGTVTIDYDDSDASGDSRTTLPIPEFSDVAATAIGAVVVAFAVRSRRRRQPCTK